MHGKEVRMKRVDSVWRMIAVLGLTALMSGVLLGFFHDLTATPIAQASARRLSESLREMMPAFSNDPLADAARMCVDGDSLTIYPCRDGRKLVGVAVESVSHNGFGGDIRMLVCFAPDGTVGGFRVLGHSETPGLGAKMEEWFNGEPRRSAIVGYAGVGQLKVGADGGTVDAITGATITSRAFVEAVNRACDIFNRYRNEQVEDRS